MKNFIFIIQNFSSLADFDFQLSGKTLNTTMVIILMDQLSQHQ